ncbi:MAG TPA: molybdopterin-dependent oxidoreductase, partial [Longimicrobiales bacterium]
MSHYDGPGRGPMTDGLKRREFLKVVGVTGAGAGLVGCSTEQVEQLLPFVVPPEDIVPGVATWYTSVCRECSAECGMWVRTREGRAVKVEGNPRHPVSQGGLCSRGHSSLQALYNPDRYAGPMVREGGELRQVTWQEAEQRLTQGLQSAGGRVLLLTGKMGPSLADVADGFVAAVGGTRVEHDGLSLAPLREATRIAFGADVVPRYDLAEARFILSFGADFLETWLSPVEHGRGFSRAASVTDGPKARTVFVGPRLNLTGQNADEWIPIAPGAEAALALGIANAITGGSGEAAGPYAPIVERYDPMTAAAAAGVEVEVIEELADHFMNAGPGVALGPGVAGHHRNATAANLAVLILNHVAGSVGRTVHVQSGATSASAAPYGAMEAAIRSMAGGNVGVVLVHGTNPAYTLPPASGFSEAFEGVGLKVSFASAPDETSAMADLILPDAHFLESWGDSNPRPGVYAVQQPAMQPVPHFDSKATADVLLAVAGQAGLELGARTFYDHLRQRWAALHGASGSSEEFEAWWRRALRVGVVELATEVGAGTPALRSLPLALTFDPPEVDGLGDFTLVVHPSSRFGDGSIANRPWMIELPDPVSKIAWHSWLEMNPLAAERLGLREGDVVRVTSPHGSVEVPLWIYPGIREDAVALSMGMGHENTGRFADGRGVRAVTLLPAVAEQPSGALVTLATRVTVEATGERYKLATIEGASEQHNRPIAPAVALADLGVAAAAGVAAEAGAGQAAEEGGHGALRELQLGGGFVPVETDGEPGDFPLPGSRYGDYGDPETPRWAMAIDLDKCTGCSACVTACASENNVPWVGEQAVAMGRDMHWIRLERYYETVDASHPGP